MTKSYQGQTVVPTDFIPIVPAGGHTMNVRAIGIYIGGAGVLVVETLTGAADRSITVVAGQILYGRFITVRAASTATLMAEIVV